MVVPMHPHHGAPLRARAWQLFTRSGTYFILTLVALISIFPLGWVLITSVKNQREVFSSLLPRQIDFSNYPHVWATMDFPLHFVNSVFVSAMTVAIVVVAATLASYAFARTEFPGREPVFFVFLAAMMIPGQAILIPLFIFFKQMGLLDSLPGLSLSYLGGSMPFAIFLMRSFFKTLPGELADAARIEGCGDFGVFRHIYLPLSRPGIATITIFLFLETWNEFMYATTFIISPGLKTIQPDLYLAIGRYSTDYASLSAGTVMAITPIVIVYLILQKQFVRGLTAGAIKG